VEPWKKVREMRYMTVIRVKRGNQWDMCQLRVLGRVGGTTKKILIRDRYHNDQGEKESSMGWVANKSVEKGVRSTKKIDLKMIGTTVIKVKRGIQWDRSQIRVHVRPLYSFFSLLLLLWSYTPT
jgi:hypothetical protein